MGMTISIGPHQMKKKPRPLVGTKTFIREQEREMRNIEWSDSFGGSVMGALLDNERERARPPQTHPAPLSRNGDNQSVPADGPPVAMFKKNGVSPDEDFANQLAKALDSAGARLTFDRGRNNTHPCTFCGERQPGVTLRLMTIGRYLDGNGLTRPVCPKCEPTAQKRMAKP